MAAWAIWTAGIATAATGLALAAWALFGDRSHGRRRCPRCWYDLAAAPLPATCPECGRTARSEPRLKRARRRWSLAAAGVAIAIAAGWVAPVWATRGWWATIPAPVLALVIDRSLAAEADAAFRKACVWPGVSTPWERRLACRGLAHRLRPMLDGEPYNGFIEHPTISNFAYRGAIAAEPAAGKLAQREALAAMFHDSNSALRKLGARLVAQMPRQRAVAIARLERILAETDDFNSAVDCWYGFTECAPAPDLYLQAFHGMELSVVSRAALVAFSVGGDEVIYHEGGPDWALQRALDVRGPEVFPAFVRRSAAIGLRRQRPPAPETVRALLGALSDPNAEVREAAQQSLEQIGHAFPAVGPGGP